MLCKQQIHKAQAGPQTGGCHALGQAQQLLLQGYQETTRNHHPKKALQCAYERKMTKEKKKISKKKKNPTAFLPGHVLIFFFLTPLSFFGDVSKIYNLVH